MLNEGYNYPPYQSHKEGKNLLLYIRNYLVLKKNKKKTNLYPPYIYENSKISENQKRYFRQIAMNYKLDENNNLLIKFKENKEIINQTNQIHNKTEEKDEKDNYRYMIVPFCKRFKRLFK